MLITDGLHLDVDKLHRQQAELCRSGRLRWLHWAIVGASLLITVFAWHISQSLLEQGARQRFTREVGRVIDLVEERMRHYEDALLSGASALEAKTGALTRAQWRRYAEKLNLTGRYPGLNGIGVIFHVDAAELEPFVERAREQSPGFRVHPETPFDFHLPITYIEPEAPNAAAVGLDVAFESRRRVAALRARRLGTTQISGSIELVQDAHKTPGFLFYAPYYAPGEPHSTGEGVSAAHRESRFRGLVYAPIVVESLVAGTLDLRNRDVAFSIRDGDSVLYDEFGGESEAAPSAATATRSLAMYGRTWTFDFRAGNGAVPDAAVEMNQSTVVLLGGLTVDVMLLVLFASMSRSNRGMLALAGKMTSDLVAQARALHASNEDLRNYAHVVSHDLKTPIRGIQDLSAFIAEDLEPYFASEGANPDVALNLVLLGRQADKGQALIQGVLNYASVGVLDETLSFVDTGSLVREIGVSLGMRPEQIVVEGELPAFDTHAIRLGQVFENLIGNAFKYHSDRPFVRVRVAAVRQGDFYRFAVGDNGPGIDALYHERIFKAFTTLGTHADESGGGIGLSIVQKSVELLGGRIEVESAPGEGATFRFDWPVSALRLVA